MRFAVDAWAPEYGTAVDEPTPSGTNEPVDVAVERRPADWAPRRPAPAAPPDSLRFVDGVRRIEARVWITAPDGSVHQGICASYAAGVVRCDGAATVEKIAVQRALFARSDGAGPLVTRHGVFSFEPVATGTPDELSLALQGAMASLEHEVSTGAPPGSLLLVDGPLRQRHRMARAVGYVKSHHRSYLPEPLQPVIAALGVGERTPVFLIDGRARRWSWYLRLPGELTHAWAGVVRCEASVTVPIDEVVGLADQVTAALPRFASSPHKDGRAPQNLYPIAGLERELRRRLGDTLLLQRALRHAAAAA